MDGCSNMSRPLYWWPSNPFFLSHATSEVDVKTGEQTGYLLTGSYSCTHCFTVSTSFHTHWILFSFLLFLLDQFSPCVSSLLPKSLTQSLNSRVHCWTQGEVCPFVIHKEPSAGLYSRSTQQLEQISIILITCRLSCSWLCCIFNPWQLRRWQIVNT